MPASQAYQPEDAFLDTLGEAARRDGRRACLSLLSELNRLPTSRGRWRPRRTPSAHYLPACLKHGPPETADLRGTIAGFSDQLHWETIPAAANVGAFKDRSTFTTLVGPGCRIPSDRVLIGLFLVDPGIHYPPHAHSAEELYFPLSGTALYGIGTTPPQERAPGTFLSHKAWESHMMWSGPDPVLILWAWMGELDGGYKLLGKAAT